MDLALAILVLIVLVAYCAEAVTGFGATVIALTLAAHLYAIDFLVPVLIVPNILLSLYIAVRYREKINHYELWKRILPLALLGMPIGFALFYLLGTQWLKRAFGAFVFVYAAIELVRLHARNRTGSTQPPLTLGKAAAWLISGGIMHGLYATGGPMIVFYSNRVLGDKGSFRSTMSLLWLLLNLALLISHSIGGTLNAHTLRTSGFLLIPVAAGLVAGEWLHHRISEERFRVLVFVLLIVAGASLTVRG